MYIIMHGNVTNHDAIGNDIELMYGLLSQNSECLVYAENCLNHNVKYIDEPQLLEVIRQKSNVVIYHHSVFWEKGVNLLSKSICNVIIRYHNVTPEKFYANYNDSYYDTCLKGRRQTIELQKLFPDALWLCDSIYNSKDLYLVKPENIRICPPFNKLNDWGHKQQDLEVMREFNSEIMNVLFVGRVVPNKGHLLLLDVIYSYKKIYSQDIKLRIIGKTDEGLNGYNAQLKDCIEKYGLTKNIEIVGDVTDEKLIAYYKNSDVMLCTSLHEGFCVPIIEAQYFGLPIVAMRSTAVPETIGSNQIVLSGDAVEMAIATHQLKHNKDMRQYMITEGSNNYNTRFDVDVIKEVFFNCINRYEYNSNERFVIESIQKNIQLAAAFERNTDIIHEIREDALERGVQNYSVVF